MNIEQPGWERGVDVSREVVFRHGSHCHISAYVNSRNEQKASENTVKNYHCVES